jgi:hypothetical protein
MFLKQVMLNHVLLEAQPRSKNVVESSTKYNKTKQKKIKRERMFGYTVNLAHLLSLFQSQPEILNHITFSLFCCFAVAVRAHS